MEKRGEEKHLHTALFTILIALLMLCFQRAHVVVSLAEQWRACIFILLNLLLLAVLFTSYPLTRTSDDEENSAKRQAERRKKFASKHRRRDTNVVKTSCASSSSAEKLCKFSNDKNTLSSNNNNVFVKKVDDEVCNERVVEDVELLSEEELNRRVEAFICMFKQHLLSDSKRKSRFVATASTTRGLRK